MLLAAHTSEHPALQHLEIILEFPARLSGAHIRKAWGELVLRHEILRARFQVEGGEVFYEPQADYDWQKDADLWRELVTPEIDRTLANESRNARFDLSSGRPLWRVRVHSRPDGNWIWSLVIHHALVDHRSLSLLLLEFARQLAGHGRPPKKQKPTPFSAYLQWLAEEDFERLKPFWESRLATLEGPTLFPRVHSIGQAERQPPRLVIEVLIPAALQARLQAFTLQQDITLNALVLSAWSLWLGRSSSSPKVCFGVVRSGWRGTLAAAEQLMGPLLNTFPMVIDLDPACAAGQFLKNVRAEWLSLYESEHCPLEQIRRWSHFPEGTPLFSSVVNYVRESPAALETNLREHLHCKLVEYRRGIDAPLALLACEHPHLQLKIDVDPRLVSGEYARAAAAALPVIIEGLLQPGSPTLRDIPLVPQERAAEILAATAGLPQIPLRYPNIQSLLADAAARHASRLALESGHISWTYAELHQRAGWAAQNLRRQGVQTQHIIALVLPTTPESIAVLLGVIRCGATFLLLDPDQPEAAAQALLVSTTPDWIVSKDLCGIVKNPRWIPPDGLLLPEPGAPPLKECSLMSGDLAYLVHTSGSTGTPKTVQIEQHSVVSVVTALMELYRLQPEDRRLQWARPGTDFFIAEILVNLCAGTCIVFRDAQRHPDIHDLVRFICNHQITVTSMPGSYWHEWMHAAQRDASCCPPENLRLCITGMEAISPSGLESWQKVRGPATDWVNVYGPSETTMVCSAYYLKAAQRWTHGEVPIGRPLPNTQLYILDDYQQVLPQGFEGEICVSGEGVMRGYRVPAGSSPSADAGRLEANPHAQDARHQWLYRTGDYGCLTPEGHILFHGRRDHQVKIRGRRIELGMVEIALRQWLDCSNSVAMAVSNGRHQALAAVIETNQNLTATDVHRALQGHLAPGMIPSEIRCLSRLPLAASGKLDRLRLATLFEKIPPTKTTVTHGAADQEPATEMEKNLAQIWSSALKGAVIGRNENFFEAGGDSLMTLIVVAQIREKFQIEIAVHELFSQQTLRGQAEELNRRLQIARGDMTNAGQGIRDQEADEILTGLRAHTRLWQVQWLPPDSTMFVLNPQGTRRPLFWSTPAQSEILNLAEALGTDQPLYGMPSGVLTMRRTEHNVTMLAAHYANGIIRQQPAGNIALGGFCQGAVIAHAVALELENRGRMVDRLMLVESGDFKPFHRPVALFFGRNSLFNPFPNEAAAAPGTPAARIFRALYPRGQTIDLIDADHDNLMSQSNAVRLAAALKKRLDDSPPLRQHQKSEAIFIVGSPHSGQRFTAEMLRRCGLRLVGRPAAPTPNPGPAVRERKHLIAAINDGLLSTLGGRWDKVPTFPDYWRLRLFEPLRLAAALHQEHAGATPWGWQDAQASVLMRFWLGLEPEARVVICLRHPAAVIRQLNRHNSIPLGLAPWIWHKYNSQLLLDAPHQNRLIIHCEDFFQKPLETLRRLCDFCRLTVQADDLKRTAQTIRMKRWKAQRPDSTLQPIPLHPDVVQLYDRLCSEAGFDHRSDS